MPGKTDKQIMYKINSINHAKPPSSKHVVKRPPSYHYKDVSMEKNSDVKSYHSDPPSGEQFKVMINGSQSGSSSGSRSSNKVPKGSLVHPDEDLGVIQEESQYDDNQSVSGSHF